MASPARADKSMEDALSLEERIRQRAYELYLKRGNGTGSEMEDWLQAEQELRNAEERGRKVE